MCVTIKKTSWLDQCDTGRDQALRRTFKDGEKSRNGSEKTEIPALVSMFQR